MSHLPSANTTARASHHLAYGNAADVLGTRDVSARIGRGLIPQRGGLSGAAGPIRVPSALSLSEVQSTNHSSGQRSADQLDPSGSEVPALQGSDLNQVPGSGAGQRNPLGGSDVATRSNLGTPRLSLVPSRDSGVDTNGLGSPSTPQQDRLPRNTGGNRSTADSDNSAGGVRPTRLVASGWDAGLRSDVDPRIVSSGRVRHGGREAGIDAGDFRGIPAVAPANNLGQGTDGDGSFNLSLLPLRGPLGPVAHGTEEAEGEGSRSVWASDDRSRLDSSVLGLASDGTIPRSVRPVDFIGEESLACYASELQTRNSCEPGAGPFERRQK